MNGPYIIAEIGLSHGGSVAQAVHLIEQVSGVASAVKFQDHRFETPQVEHPNVPGIDAARKYETRAEYLQRTSFNLSQWGQIQRAAKHEALDFIVSPFSAAAAHELWHLVDSWKVASGQIKNAAMLKVMADSGKPVFWSTGMSRSDEIMAPKMFEKSEVTYMQCTSSYPVVAREIGLGTIRTLAADGFKVGFSDHWSNVGSISLAAAMAIGAGATVIERHVHPGPDTYHNDLNTALTPEQFDAYCVDLQLAWRAVHEAKSKDDVARSLAGIRRYFMWGDEMSGP